jgi:hypothetical protein
MYTDDYINELITCEKQILETPREGKEPRAGYRKTTFSLLSLHGEQSFTGFINQNLTFLENYSLGLVHLSKNEYGKVVLIRCNGLHGENEQFPHHIGCHIHTATAKRIEDGLKPEGNIIMTNEYLTIEEAIQFYLKKIGILASDRLRYFPPAPPIQLSMWGDLNK